MVALIRVTSGEAAEFLGSVYALMISRTVIPLGIMGSTCSWYGTWTSSTYGTLDAIISSSASSMSFFSLTRRVPQRNPRASVTKIRVRRLSVTGAEVRVATVAAVEPVFPLHDHAQVLVVQEQHLDRQLFA